ncbi:Detected protein of unknown function [Hibiscus syriacus]|uniref:AMP-dependent synthetase/ligase domain-containing protein n=1 Tax=Hibiscus syriacus TaxID=106335 RepID=A0A6A3AWJ9_HIBSY|nr:Detected protein of unknown function [Hibiscus syriacus]
MENLLFHCSTNHSLLSPVSFLDQAANAYGDKVSIVYGTVSFSWRQTHQRCLKLASALTQLGISSAYTVTSRNLGQ